MTKGDNCEGSVALWRFLGEAGRLLGLEPNVERDRNQPHEDDR